MRRALGLCAALVCTGCVYYNGVYNAKRLSREAERAEREGRTIDAQGLWAQVVVKADSVIARHPASGYIPQVELLRARAMARGDHCPEAAPALQRALPAVTDSAAVEAGTFELARCLAQLGNAAAAADVYARVIGARDPAVRAEVQYQYVHALRLAGRFDAALAAAEGLADPRLPYERMVALGGTGKLADALVFADSAIARGDTTAPWDSLLSAAGRRDPGAVSPLVDRLVAMPQATPAMKGRWLLGDGRQLLAIDTARADARLAAAAVAGGPSEFAGRARLARARVALARATSSAALGLVVDTLEALRTVAGARDEAPGLADAVTRVRAATDSAAAGAPRADLALFLAAETARDVLESPELARLLFRRVLAERGDSPYAPKALLALHQLDPSAVPAFDSLLTARYAGSPYVAALRGEALPAFRTLEDSLGAFAASFGVTPASAPRPGVGGRGQPQSPGTRRPVEPQ
ncbi:MAG TPA: hypothetical protein VJ847_08080 [Gemmatimonadales bacterium]|nr:hypothetical protein [Gemmatimonadales bacterium]